MVCVCVCVCVCVLVCVCVCGEVKTRLKRAVATAGVHRQSLHLLLLSTACRRCINKRMATSVLGKG